MQVLVEQVLAIPHSLEINPARAQKGTDVRANADIILSLAQVFIDKLQTTMVLCPLYESLHLLLLLLLALLACSCFD